MEIKIYERNQVNLISTADWIKLAKNALIKNPFYEYWCLMPALKWLDKDVSLCVVCIYNNEQLVGLFPVARKKKYGFIKYIAVWEHIHCFLTTPIFSEELDWNEIFKQIFKYFKVGLICHFRHDLDMSQYQLNHYFTSYLRPAIKGPKNWDEYKKSLSKNQRSNYLKCLKKMFIGGDTEYINDIERNLEYYMNQFIQLEGAGWKGGQGGALVLRPDEAKYYLEMAGNSEAKGFMRFNLIKKNETIYAIRFEFVNDGFIFAVKTTYNEEFKKLNPGVALALKSFENYCSQNFKEVDSCTSPDNYVLSRMWTDKKEIFRSWLFYSSINYRTFSFFYPRLSKWYKKIKNNRLG